MKKNKIFFVALLCLLASTVYSQQYQPFPTDTAVWSHAEEHHGGGYHFWINYQYYQQGDTILKGKTYNKIYYNDFFYPLTFIGGIREDSLKNIYFFPHFSSNNNYPSYWQFPSDTMEYLLYPFNNLDSGVVVPINTANNTIEVYDVDSILIGNKYHKRYKMYSYNMIFHYEYWIEGIGSTKDLFAPYSYEFEWQLFTLCFEDTQSYYINPPYGADSCHYNVSHYGIDEQNNINISIYPNPTQGVVNIESDDIELIELLSPSGQIIKREVINRKNEVSLDIHGMAKGIYFIKVYTTNAVSVRKIILE